MFKDTSYEIYKNKKCSFIEKVPGESNEDYVNPSRGWYEIYNFNLKEKADFDELKWCLRENEALAFIRIDIGDARDGSLSEEQLEYIEEILDYFGRAGKDIILRFVYDTQGLGNLYEPEDISIIITHIRQLGDIIKKHRKEIFVFQGLLIGSWGEMHTSAYNTPENIRKLAATVRNSIGDDIYMAVRKPVQLRYLRDEVGRVGLFNDGLFGSDNHLGTFGEKKRKESLWDEPWIIDDELAFENQLCETVPSGGEAVLGDSYDGGRFSVQMLDKMHISYLNCVHDKKILDRWKEEIIEDEGIWQGKSYFDYISCYLGYRILVKKVSFRIKSRGKASVYVEFENIGFASLYDKVQFEIIITPTEDYTQSYSSCSVVEYDDIIKSHEKGSVKIDIDVCPGVVYVALRRKKDGRLIKFANRYPEDSDCRELYVGRLE